MEILKVVALLITSLVANADEIHYLVNHGFADTVVLTYSGSTDNRSPCVIMEKVANDDMIKVANYHRFSCQSESNLEPKLMENLEDREIDILIKKFGKTSLISKILTR